MSDPLALLDRAIGELGGQDPHQLSETVLLESTETLLKLRHQLDGVIAKRLQVVDVRDATTAEYGRKTRSWLIEDLCLGHQEASKLLTVAKALPQFAAIEAALLCGDINIEHARNIAVSTKSVDPEIQDVFEKELVKAAGYVDPTTLGSVARELRSRLGADENAEAAEQRLYDGRWLKLTRTFDGMHHLDGMLDPASAATVQSALAPLCRKSADGDDRSTAQRRADALTMLAELALSTGQLPELGGEKPQLVCSISWDQLRAELESGAAADAAMLNGLPVSPSTARMIACTAGVIPAILGSDGEVLDLGRKTPMWTAAQRRALNLESPGCGWPGCHTELAYCQAHHITHWAHGGHTQVRNGINLCRYHHHLIHHSNWQISKNHHNQIRVWRT